MKKLVVILSLVTLFFSGCEKDDICSEETTPRVIVEFFDIANPTVNKSVTALAVKTVDSEGVVLADLGVFNSNKLELPLVVSQNPEESTRYSLVLNSTSSNVVLQNEDFLTFRYSQRQLYVSRACGFKTVFQLNEEDGLSVSGNLPPDLNWIQEISINTRAINSEKVTHVKVFF